MSVQYDPNIITKHAQALYNRASGIIFAWSVIGFIAGLVMTTAMNTNAPGLIVVLGGLVVAFIGAMFGRGRAFALQLQAQVALCQVATEANTRRAANSAAAAVPTTAPESVNRAG
ncbi:hypothetical protein HJC10_02210 [Corallococcus exiguus]|uniref:hypothetical protein n=1 Tax=Corallococcus TaxID=83461 RepID=UPI000EEA6FBE|nr:MULTISPECIES: hypothetical protein [Corallococcus]NNB86975.1 hypothetical protein [Corallococcus exiguus]NNB95841.1 hypothetical protein [Corallococcus exiguus]NNC01669.1 hypothetical protein [Corallococcus exiguus]NPC47597.1 hypothetical protein [Corallococcus exiguus]RKH84508.1 hypothetical protein D7X99_09430 [Corallococcus sp. AB032C]